MKWRRLEHPKSQGGCGLKEIQSFGLASIAKSLYNFLFKDNVWKQILVKKYLIPKLVVYWLQKEAKSPFKLSNQWKAMTTTFPIIVNFLAWKVNNGLEVRVGRDDIMG